MINDTIEEVGDNHTTLANAGCNGEPFRQFISDTNTAFTVGVHEFSRRRHSFGGVPEMRTISQRDMRSMLSKAALKSTNAMYNVRLCSFHFWIISRRAMICSMVERPGMKPACCIRLRDLIADVGPQNATFPKT